MTDETKDTSANACPECGDDLSNRDRQAHANFHWRGTGDAAPKPGTDAYKRQQQVLGKSEDKEGKQ